MHFPGEGDDGDWVSELDTDHTQGDIKLEEEVKLEEIKGDEETKPVDNGDRGAIKSLNEDCGLVTTSKALPYAEFTEMDHKQSVEKQVKCVLI